MQVGHGKWGWRDPQSRGHTFGGTARTPLHEGLGFCRTTTTMSRTYKLLEVRHSFGFGVWVFGHTIP